MIAFARMMVFGFVVLSVVYVIVAIYARSVERERLEKEWDGDPANQGAAAGGRDAYIKAGLKEYHGSLRRKLIWLVYIIPLVALVALNYINTFN